LQAQTVQNAQKIKRGTLWYYLHLVQKNETLSQIAQAYKVSVKEIQEVNTALTDIEKIRDGQGILIPDFSSFIDKYPRDRWTFELYRVKSGDKLKNIARNFDADVKDIKNINPGIDSKPPEGAEIRVPVLKRVMSMAMTSAKTSSQQDSRDSNRDARANPAVSFNWDSKPAAGEENEQKKKDLTDCREFKYDARKHIFNISIMMPLQENSGAAFIEGLLLAAEELKNGGTNLNLNIIETGKDEPGKYLNSKTLEEANLIIAPFDLNDLKLTAAFASRREIPVVAPYQPRGNILIAGNPYLLQVYPSDNAIYAKLAENSFNRNEINPVLIRPATADSTMLSNYRNALKAGFGTFAEHVHTIGLRPGNSKLSEALNIDRHNLIFVCSNAEAFVSDFLNSLNAQRGKTRVSVYGRSTWRDFKNIDRARYFDLNLHLVQAFHVDYSNEDVKNFIRNYRLSYNSEPSQYAFHGYDILSYFVAAMKKYGSGFLPCISDFQATFLQSRYRFEQSEKDGGYVNGGCFMLEYSPTDIEVRMQ
jgi:LysM repeat protein